MLLLIDNYDSIVFNLARHFERLGQATRVVRNDTITIDQIETIEPEAIILSPGPCTPSEAGCSLEIVRRLHGRVPILGICLGHQAIGAAFGAQVVRAPQPVHGRTSEIYHTGGSVFAGLASPMLGCRYHSLVVDEYTLPECLEVTARTADGVIMALAHRKLPVVGLQFHPESILTLGGYELLAGFLRIAGIERSAVLPSRASELAGPDVPPAALPTAPVTF